MKSALLFLLLIGMGWSDCACAQWIHTPGTESDFVLSFDSLGGNLYAGAKIGLFVTRDSGKNWGSGGLDSIYITGLLHRGNNLFAATGFGVYSSTDLGSHWTLDTVGMDYVNVSSIATGDSTLIAGTLKGIYYSSDNGQSWHKSRLSEGYMTALANPIAASGSDAYAASNQGDTVFTYYSSDEGRTWTRIGFLPNSNYQLVKIGSNLYSANTNGFGVFVSTDNGASWRPMNNGLPVGPAYFTIHSFLPVDSNLFTGTSLGVFYSADSGQFWGDISDGADSGNFYVWGLFEWNGYLWAGGGLQSAGIWYRSLSDILGTNDVKSVPATQENVSAYPNPVESKTTISLSLDREGAAELSVVNLLGTTVGRLYEGELSGGNHRFTFDASGLAPGMYEAIFRFDGAMQEVPILVTR